MKIRRFFYIIFLNCCLTNLSKGSILNSLKKIIKNITMKTLGTYQIKEKILFLNFADLRDISLFLKIVRRPR